MNIYKVEWPTRPGRESYLAFICAAENEDSARRMHPADEDDGRVLRKWNGTGWEWVVPMCCYDGSPMECDGDYWFSTEEERLALVVTWLGTTLSGMKEQVFMMEDTFYD